MRKITGKCQSVYVHRHRTCLIGIIVQWKMSVGVPEKNLAMEAFLTVLSSMMPRVLVKVGRVASW
jgi:hypothetical protein